MFPAGTRFIKYHREDYFVGSERSYFMKAFVPAQRVDEFMGQATIEKADWNHPPSSVGDASLLEEWSGGELVDCRTMQIPLRRPDNLTDTLIIRVVDKRPAGIDIYLDCENYSLVDRRPSAKW